MKNCTLHARIIVAILLLLASEIFPHLSFAQDTTTHFPNGTEGLMFRYRTTDTVFVNDKKADLAPNEFQGKYSTFNIGLGFIGDFTAYAQSRVFKQQMDSAGLDLTATYKTRDFRILANGRLLKTKRLVAWKFAYMYDGDKKVWMLRETGLTIGLSELKGNFFIGRTKEGFSMIKVMNGHSGIINERQMALDPIPILADGIKYFGYFPKSGIFLNLAVFNDFMSKGQSFSTYEWQYVARAGWVPINDAKNSKLIHIAGNFRYGKPLDGKFSIKSRPESNPTPQLINTGQFEADHSSSIGAEFYYSNRRFSAGSEVMQHNFYSSKYENHVFRGGNVFVSYFFTRTTRPYNSTANVFGFVPVRKSVFDGGWGEIEGVLHISTFDLNDKSILGGQFTRITAMANWYLSKIFRWELTYGYGILDRYQLKGNVQFFETRIQLTIM